MIPQAVTTRDMTDAYRWLQTLPQSVRDEMKSMEQVVSLYLKAKRLGGNAPTPEDFQKTLKGIKHELDQFDFQSPPQHPPLPTQQQVAPTMKTPEEIAAQNSLLAAVRMDPKSRQIITEIRDALNLSSDLEVVRMCLVLAHKTIKDLIS